MQSAVKHYYNVNKILMTKLGIWPTQSTFVKILLPTIMTAFVFSIVFLEVETLETHKEVFAIIAGFQFVRLLEIWRRLTDDCESFIMIILALGASIKLFLVVIKNKTIKLLLSLIDYHWRIFSHSLEIPIMHKYALVARKMTISYTAIIYSLTILYLLMPLTPQILDVLMPLNASRPYIYLFDVDYSFDKEEYYYPVLLHSYVAMVFAVTAMIITDTSYLTFAQHACSLFAAIGYQLENLTLKINLKKNHLIKEVIYDRTKRESIYEDIIYREMVLLVRKHQLTLEFVDLLESFFEVYAFSMIFLHFIAMSLLGIQVITFMNQTAVVVRYIALIIGGFFHLLILSYPGQEIMDHSVDIFNKAYNMLWYKTSRRTTRLLSILLYRGLVPCTLTAGKIYVMSMENYASVMKGTLSYFTALSSFK